jgi:type VI secretion system protein ImpK
MMPAPVGEKTGDDDATVMMPAPVGEKTGDDDATVMMPAHPVEPEPAAGPDPEATIAIPTPGRKRDADSPALPAAPAAGSQAADMDPAALGGLNRLVAAANPVLAVVVQIRHTLKHPDPAGLRASLRQRVDAFEACCACGGRER